MAVQTQKYPITKSIYMKFNVILVVILTIFLSKNLSAQANLLQSGPMLGYVDMKEALLWVQTKSTATVHFEYWPTAKPTEKHSTEKAVTLKHYGYTAKCIADEIEPGITYDYQLFINDKAVKLPYPTQFKSQTLWQYRSDPPTFTIATGSCAYVNDVPYDRPGKGYGSDYQIFTNIAAAKPDVMLWLGDNTYLREPDWATRTGMLHRYTHTRSLPEMQPLLASTSHVAIWDDHDFGPNDANGSWAHKETSLDIFQSFWGNPTNGVNGQKGITTFYNYGDVDMFLLDDRYFRAPDVCATCDRTQLGQTQLDWMIAALKTSSAPFKLVAIGGQIITSSPNHETYAHYFKAERDSILTRIEREDIKGVIFLTGDRHFTELSSLKNAKGNTLYDLTVSPLTSGPYKGAAEKDPNQYRSEGTVFDDHNFALLKFSGPRKARVLEITVKDANGKEIWKKTINE
jgi:alkaline phosphatase D